MQLRRNNRCHHGGERACIPVYAYAYACASEPENALIASTAVFKCEPLQLLVRSCCFGGSENEIQKIRKLLLNMLLYFSFFSRHESSLKFHTNLSSSHSSTSVLLLEPAECFCPALDFGFFANLPSFTK